MTLALDRLPEHIKRLRAAPDVSDRAILEDVAEALADVCEVLLAQQHAPLINVSPLVIPHLRMNDATGQVWWKERELTRVPAQEFLTLKLFVNTPGQVFSFEQIWQAYGGTAISDSYKIVNDLKYRFKEADPYFNHLRNKWNVGYYWATR